MPEDLLSQAAESMAPARATTTMFSDRGSNPYAYLANTRRVTDAQREELDAGSRLVQGRWDRMARRRKWDAEDEENEERKAALEAQGEALSTLGLIDFRSRDYPKVRDEFVNHNPELLQNPAVKALLAYQTAGHERWAGEEEGKVAARQVEETAALKFWSPLKEEAARLGMPEDEFTEYQVSGNSYALHRRLAEMEKGREVELAPIKTMLIEGVRLGGDEQEAVEIGQSRDILAAAKWLGRIQRETEDREGAKPVSLKATEDRLSALTADPGVWDEDVLRSARLREALDGRHKDGEGNPITTERRLKLQRLDVWEALGKPATEAEKAVEITKVSEEEFVAAGPPEKADRRRRAYREAKALLGEVIGDEPVPTPAVPAPDTEIPPGTPSKVLSNGQTAYWINGSWQAKTP